MSKVHGSRKKQKRKLGLNLERQASGYKPIPKKKKRRLNNLVAW